MRSLSALVLSLGVAGAVLASSAAANPPPPAETPKPAPKSPDPKPDAGPEKEKKKPIPPDPPAMDEREQWVYDLRWDRGEPYLVGVHKIDTGGPHPTPRVMGRFALELFEGPTLIERVRFDFPMLGVPDDADAGGKAAPRFEPKLKTRIGVLFPATKRGNRLELWDRATDRRWPLPWPP